MITDQRVLDNVKKLLDLGMTPEDVKDNLIKMGVSEKDAIDLIQRAGGVISKQKTEEELDEIKELEKQESINFAKPPETPKKESQPQKQTTPSQQQTKQETIPKQTFEKAPEPKKEEIPSNAFSFEEQLERIKKKSIAQQEKPKEEIKLNLFPEFEELKKQAEKPTTDFFQTSTFETKTQTTDVWKEGILTTINQKLDELDTKQQNLEKYLKEKIDFELKKLSGTQIATQKLLLDKINEMINTQLEDIQSKITSELAQIKVSDVKLAAKIKAFEEEKNDLSDVISKLEKTHGDMITSIAQNKIQMSDFLEKTNQQIANIISNTKTKLDAKLQEINNTLALQSRITQGLIKNTQTIIEREVMDLKEFKEKIESQINPKQIYDKLNELDSFKEALANRYEKRFDEVKQEFLIKAKDAMQNEINKELKELRELKETIVLKTDPDIIKREIDKLLTFKAEVLASIDEKITQVLKVYEGVNTQEFRKKIDELEKYKQEISTKLKDAETITEKLKELDKFKEQFIAIIDKHIDDMNKKIDTINQKFKELGLGELQKTEQPKTEDTTYVKEVNIPKQEIPKKINMPPLDYTD
ncbi:MAG TPA: hypothetical protein P5513_02875 [Candidatus Diapherotrites archaeon]|nr:hypothetical protein [Candidatus Diapherotrites archaeon]